MRARRIRTIAAGFPAVYYTYHYIIGLFHSNFMPNYDQFGKTNIVNSPAAGPWDARPSRSHGRRACTIIHCPLRAALTRGRRRRYCTKFRVYRVKMDKKLMAYAFSSAKGVDLTLSSVHCTIGSFLTPGPSPLSGEGCLQSTINAPPVSIRFRAAPPLHKMERGLGGEDSQTKTHTEARAIPMAC